MKRQFCTCCLKSTVDYVTLTLEDGRGRFHLCREAAKCTDDTLRRAEYVKLFTDNDVLIVPPVPTTEQEATAFLRWCETAIGGGFHPDTRGPDYVNVGYEVTPAGIQRPTTPTFTDVQAVAYDEGIEACFVLLEDLYAVSLDIFHELHPETAA